MEFFNDLGSDPLKPSLFELVAQEQLRDLLQPALKYVLAVFAQRYPRYLIRIVNRHEEFYALIMLLVERYYLRKYNASFSENFYGLKRRRRPYIEIERVKAAVGGIPDGEALRPREIGRSLLFLVSDIPLMLVDHNSMPSQVGVPYLRAKAQDYYEELGGGVSSDVLDEEMGTRQAQALTEDTFKARLKRGFKAAYPWLNTSFEVWLLVCNMAYLFDRTPFYRPWLSWIGVDLRRLGSEDFRAAALAAQAKVSPDKRRGIIAWIRRSLIASPNLLLDSLRLLLPTAIFFVKFLEWWYSPGSPARALSTSPLGPAVPPPRMLPPHPQGISFDKGSYGICPICHAGINNATALPSGYVFCYRCAYDQVEKHGRCPVTLLPARVFITMKFGKHIQGQQVPGWSTYYLDYKFLKKIISSLAANRPASEAAALASGIRPTDLLAQSISATPIASPQSPSSILDGGPRRPPLFSGSGQDSDRGADFRAHKAAFFFKLERELEKINDFYLQKEAELKLRMETLLSKRRAAAMRGLPDTTSEVTQNHVEWSAVEEGFRLLERDLGKLQQFVEVNATGFRKILKKFDKRSKSTTKELYLSRQVDVQPVFNRQLISELSDTVAICLLDLTDLSSGLKFEGSAANDIFAQQILAERTPPMGPFRDLENNLRKAVAARGTSSVSECVRYSDVLAETNGGKPIVTRILWNIIIEAPPDMADLILSSLSSPFDFQYVDDINERTCHPAVCKRLLEANLPPSILDRDNYSPLVYATMKGNVECVRVLLDEGKVPVEPTTTLDDLIPLSLASQSGHVDVVVLLLQHGARCLPNSNGEYPMHLAAREGYDEVCKLLTHLEGWDTPDKYHEWTPLFHAARYGQDRCVRILLEAGARIDATDELGHLAVHYAAWYGHQKSTAQTIMDVDSPMSEAGRSEFDIDLIPSLSLPPPIMPHRVYGHNYLDKSNLIQVTIGHTARRATKLSGVRLHHRLISPVFEDEYLLASTPLKLVMTSNPNVTSAPYSVSLPQRDERGIFTFQIPSPENLSLEFSVYPNFGTKTIGRAVALPSLFRDLENKHAFTLPILDTRLHVVGEVDFEVKIVTPFEGVTLEVGGDVETYWKSMVMPPSIPQLGSPKWPHRSSLIGSAQASPSVHSITNGGGQFLTISSLQGNYIYSVVQVTKDFQPVIFSDWLLPDNDFDLGVSDVTLAQFELLAHRSGRGAPSLSTFGVGEWSSLLSRSMISLAQLLKLLPVGVNICLELAYPSRMTTKRLSLGHRLDLNDFVDSVLRNIYHASAPFDAPYARRKLAFASFSPDVCSVLNWKQPNYPVFFISRCGKNSAYTPSAAALDAEEENDPRLSSIGAAVEFARINNLLGVFVDADLLVQVPSLIHGIRNAGLIVGTHGQSGNLEGLSTTSGIEGTPVDAVLGDGKVVFTNHSMQELM
ncbi:cyclin-dependent protein kinase inhibitor [Lyophyllum atratum]|nr:cyclin-dependent protein kinase inhibitor [Lyophyllum atratum]